MVVNTIFKCIFAYSSSVALKVMTRPRSVLEFMARTFQLNSSARYPACDCNAIRKVFDEYETLGPSKAPPVA